MKRGTIALSWGPWGGFYLHPSRICLGWFALTYCPVELDDLMEAYAQRVDAADVSWSASSISIHFSDCEAEVDGSGYTRGGM